MQNFFLKALCLNKIGVVGSNLNALFDTSVTADLFTKTKMDSKNIW